ncbi:hypothetical protein BH11MYX3_BH11MYX3_00550 [soil metagenome]
MSLRAHLLGIAATTLLAAGCAKGQSASPDGGSSGGDSGATPDASCGTMCDQDKDGVVDGSDDCPNTPAGSVVNRDGCADSQLMWKLEPTFPSYGLTWVPTGDLGKPGGLTWTYTGIERGDLFHIAWLVCDDPTTPCGLSLDGAIDAAGESWQLSATDSDLANGKMVFTNTTRILLADTTTPALDGRLTITITDASDVAIPFTGVAMLGMTARLGNFAAEINGAGFKVVALAEVTPAGAATWTPYIDYYNAAPTPMAGGDTRTSFGGSFYDK